MNEIKLDFSRKLSEQQVISDIIKNDPHPISRLVEVFVRIYDEKQTDRAFREMIKLFASTFKYTGLIIISNYLELIRSNRLPEVEETKHIDNFLYVNLSGMSMGHWQYCLREISRLAIQHDIQLFVPELLALYWKNGKKLSQTAKWIDNKMIPLRNDYVHSDIWIDHEIADKMIREYFPNLISYIKEIEFLRNYPLQQAEDKKFYLQNSQQEKLVLEHFIVYSQKDEWTKDEMLLYETLKGKSIKYLLGNFYNFESEYVENIKSIQALLRERLSALEPAQKQSSETKEIVVKLQEEMEAGTKILKDTFQELNKTKELPGQINSTIANLKQALADFNKVDSNLQLLKKQMQMQKEDDWHRYQTASILNLYREIFHVHGRKFDLNEFEALFIDRYEVRNLYSGFTSSKKAQLSFILAESGAGKTTFCQKIAVDFFKKVNQQIRDTADILFYIPGNSISADDTENSLISTFSYPGKDLAEMFRQLAGTEKPKDGNFIIIIDGLNENENPNELLKFIVEFVRNNRYDFLKILLTCRIVMWDTIRKGLDFPIEMIYPDVAEAAGQEEVPFVRLAQFNNIDVEKAYDKYAANRFIKTKFYQLSPFIRETCKDPFILNILTEAYRGTHRKRTVIKPDSLATIFEQYIFSAKPRKLTRPTAQNPHPKDMQIIQQILHLMWENHTDLLPEELIRQNELLTESIYEPNPVVEKGDSIQCSDLICHWHWQPDEAVNFPFLCPSCQQNTLIWESADEIAFLACESAGCGWKWLPEKNDEIRFKCPNGHALKWSSADYRTPYNRLLDEGILTEVIREDGAFLVRFKYDRIFEFLMAREYLHDWQALSEEIDMAKVLSWLQVLQQAKINPIFQEAVATAISLAANNMLICQQLLAKNRQQQYNAILTASLKKIAVGNEQGQAQVLNFMRQLLRKQQQINEIVIPVTYYLRRDGLAIICLMLNNKNKLLNKAGSELLFRISSTNIEDGLFLINEILSKIKPTNIMRRAQSISILLEICLKICTMAEPEVVATIMHIWAKMFRYILGYGRKNIALSTFRNFLKFILLTVGSGFLVQKFRQIKIGQTDLYKIMFTKSKTKDVLLTLTEFMTPQPERISEIKDIILDALVADDEDPEGMAFVGLFAILILNVQLRNDKSGQVISVAEYLFEKGDLYTRWVICSALNYSLQESYFSSRETRLKPLEQDPEIVQRYRAVMQRFLAEEKEGYVQDYLKVGDYFFPLGIISQFSYATDNDNELIWEVFNSAIKAEDLELLKKMLLDMTCFSLDTFCYQRRFWEKTYDILAELITRLYPQKNAGIIFQKQRENLDTALIEALAIMQYAHPEETEMLLAKLVNSYMAAVNENSRKFVMELNQQSKTALHGKFQVLRTNVFQIDKKGREVELKDITEFVDGFLTGWIYADFTSAIFGRYPAFRNVAKEWIKEPFTEQYEKKPARFFKKLFGELFVTLQNFEPEIPEFE